MLLFSILKKMMTLLIIDRISFLVPFVDAYFMHPSISNHERCQYVVFNGGKNIGILLFEFF